MNDRAFVKILHGNERLQKEKLEYRQLEYGLWFPSKSPISNLLLQFVIG